MFTGCQSQTTTTSSAEPEAEVVLDPDPEAFAKIASGECSGCNLQGVRLGPLNLQDADLQNINFERAILRGINFAGANLSGAKLIYSDLRPMEDPVSFDSSDLSNADLSNSNIQGASFVNATLENTNLSGTNLHEVDFGNTPLTGADLTGAIYSEETNSTSDLSELGAHFFGPGGNLSGADINRYFSLVARTDLTGADLSSADLSHMIIVDTSFEGANLREANLEGSSLSQAQGIYGSGGEPNIFSNADLTEANLKNTDIRGLDLSSANLKGVILEGALYDETTTFPDNFDPEKSGAVRFQEGENLEGVTLSGRLIVAEAGESINLKGADLSSSFVVGDFPNADFSGAQLRNAMINGDFKGSNFEGANFTGAIIKADLREANLNDATFTDSIIIMHSGRMARDNYWLPEGFYPNEVGATIVDLAQEFAAGVDTKNFTELDFSGLPNIMWQLIHNGNVIGVRQQGNLADGFAEGTFMNFSGAEVVGKEKDLIFLFNNYGMNLNNADLININWHLKTFEKSGFQETKFKNVDMSYARFFEPNFYLAELRNVNLYGAQFLPAPPNREASSIYLSNIESACMVTLPDGQMVNDGC